MREDRRVLGVLAAGSGLAIAPFLILCAYWHPVGTHGVDWISNWGGKYDAVSWWSQQVDWYRTTMGRYSSTALLSTVSHWYSLTAGRIAVLALHLGLGAALYTLLRTIFSGWRTTLLLTITLLALYVSQLSNPYDSLYRLSGLFIYQTGLIGTLLFAACLFKERWAAAALLLVLTGGMNEISLLHLGLLTGGYFYLRPHFLRTGRGWLLVVTAVATAAVALLAPGNFVRAGLYASAAPPPIQLAGLVLATGGFTWISWLTSTTLLPLLVLGMGYLPRLDLARRHRHLLLISALVLPVLSFAPVLLATRGDSFPEGIADWQIIPVSLLLLLWAASGAAVRLSKAVSLPLALFVVGFQLLGGLGIDRQRDQAVDSPLDRVELRSPPGRAWLQLLRGRSQSYDRSVMAQYEEMRRCASDPCRISPLQSPTDNFLYDPSYDRRIRAKGDPWFGYLTGQPHKPAVVAPADR